MKYLNLGCGRHFHGTWINIDFSSSSEKEVIAWDLTKGIPYPDCSFDVVYSSHLLEHFPKNKAKSFLDECYRVLRPKGIMRIVVPDLEQITKTYLHSLQKASSGSKEWADNYNWILLEMYDQTVRNCSGGEMAKYFFNNIPNQDFVIQRLGGEAENLLKHRKMYQEQIHQSIATKNKSKHLFKQIYRFIRCPSYHRESILKLLLGREYEALQIGRFRQSGEVHQWMYDRYSLGLMLKKCGLEKIVSCTASESYISNWTSFNLDTESDGTTYKPDSLFMEAIKPIV